MVKHIICSSGISHSALFLSNMFPSKVWSFFSKIDTEQRLGTVSKKSVDSRFKSAVVKDGPSAHFSATFTYEELSFATNNFRSESLIGRGGFGAVFKGKLESTGQVNSICSKYFWFSSPILVQTEAILVSFLICSQYFFSC